MRVRGFFEWEGKSLSVDNFLPGEKAEVLISQKDDFQKRNSNESLRHRETARVHQLPIMRRVRGVKFTI